MYKNKHDLHSFLEGNKPLALVEIDSVHGSTPREEDAWMLVSPTRTFRTIGGGQLESMAIEKARELLTGNKQKKIELHVPLGPHLGQCCGGVVNLRVGRLGSSEAEILKARYQVEMEFLPDVYIFGAGHVGKALVQSLSLLPVNPIIVDTRSGELQDVPDLAEKRLVAIPESEVRSARSGSSFIILTHDHGLDFLIAREVLARNDAAYVGMIGSKTKLATFRNWLRRESGSEPDLGKLTCPIGDTTVRDKRPEVIAALVTAELVTHVNQYLAQEHNKNNDYPLPKLLGAGK